MTQQLPTQAEMFAKALASLDESRNAAAAARDWLQSDWSPLGTPLTDQGAKARSETLRRIGEIKEAIDCAKGELHDALAELGAPPDGGTVVVESVVSNTTVEDFLSPPSDAENAARRTDLIGRARAVQRNGWDDYRYVWSSGEVAGVAYLLDDTEMLAELGETEPTVLSRYAYDLFGMSGGRKDTDAGFIDTRAWFATARDALQPGAGGAT